MKLNTITWIALVALICANMMFSENNFEHSFLIITAFSIIKFLSVAFQFMEVKHAHIAWKMLTLSFALIYLVGILVLY